jgi:gamma-glutamyltranspeptidase/glutathione hydrolase
LTADYLLAKGIKEMPQRGINAVTVPGAVNGWDKLLKKFGRKSFAEVLAPAIVYADSGFPIGEVVSAFWRDSEKDLRADEPTAKTYLVNGHVPVAGEVFVNRDMA